MLSRRILSLSLLLVTSATLAQQPAAAPTPAPATVAPKLITDADTEPLKDTDDPTLLKAQILLLQNASEAYRLQLEQAQTIVEAKKAKFRQVIQANQKAVSDANTAKQKTSHEHGGDQLKSEMEQVTAANKAKIAAAEAAKTPQK